MRTPSDLVGNDVSLFDLISLAAATFIAADEERSDKLNIKWEVGKPRHFTPIANKQTDTDSQYISFHQGRLVSVVVSSLAW